MPASPALNRPFVGVACIVVGMAIISLQDVLIKQLSGGYPLHQLIFVRSAIGIAFSVVFLELEGGLKMLRTATPWQHVARCLLVAVANMTYFAALAAMPLADAVALFFVAPLMITLLSIPMLGEKVGPRRLGAVVVGFVGVLVMFRPGFVDDGPSLWVMALPVLAAFAYAMMQILTRKLGATAVASALAIYVQASFLTISVIFFVVAGDGRFVDGVEDPSLKFLLRAWIWPTAEDWPVFIAIGVGSGAIGYLLSQAYRLADAATVAPFEYVALPLAILWGWMFFAEIPGPATMVGIALILGAGLYVFLRERVRRARPPRRPLRRH